MATQECACDEYFINIVYEKGIASLKQYLCALFAARRAVSAHGCRASMRSRRAPTCQFPFCQRHSQSARKTQTHRQGSPRPPRHNSGISRALRLCLINNNRSRKCRKCGALCRLPLGRLGSLSYCYFCFYCAAPTGGVIFYRK